MAGELIIVTAPDTGDEWELHVGRERDDDLAIDGAIVDEFLTHQVPARTLAVSGDHGFIGAWLWDGDDAYRISYCPTCGSPRPESPYYAVTLCTDAWHSMPVGLNDIDTATRLRDKLRHEYPGRAGWWTR